MNKPEPEQILSTWDLPAIATFCAFGFFLDDDTYYKNEKFRFDETTPSGSWLDAFAKFDWHYDPADYNLETATRRFAQVFEEILDDQTRGQRVILPLSGGLDSRTQAAGLKRLGASVTAFSYRFDGGIDETAYAREIARACGYPLESWTVPPGYLWQCIDDLATLNKCYTDFTHPRQMAFSGSYARLGQVFSLGHWGDVLFDGTAVDNGITIDKQVSVILQKFVKKGGAALAEDLWKTWSLEGTWIEYISERIRQLLVKIPISNHASARIRAFKSRYWATRWTAANFPVFEQERPITAPYFDTRMCAFVCTVPEQLLAGRKIQIEFLRKFMPELARITWQAQRPFNLFTYHWNNAPWNLPFRVMQRVRNEYRQRTGQPFIQRNWELQFNGAENTRNLLERLRGNRRASTLVPTEIVTKYFRAFTEGSRVLNAHPLSMLLTLSVFAGNRKS